MTDTYTGAVDLVHGILLKHEYDPEKRREYYLRTRELKGRQKGSGIVDNRKKPGTSGIANAPQNPAGQLTKKDRVNNLANRAMANLGPEKQQAIQRLQMQAKTDLTKLTDELREWVAKNGTVSSKQRERIDADAKKKIAAVPPVPAGVSSKDRARLTRERSAKIAKIQGEATAKKSAAADNKALAAKKNEINAKKNKIVADLKSAVSQVVSNGSNTDGPGR